mgnify:CR=1 FL=1
MKKDLLVKIIIAVFVFILLDTLFIQIMFQKKKT